MVLCLSFLFGGDGLFVYAQPAAEAPDAAAEASTAEPEASSDAPDSEPTPLPEDGDEPGEDASGDDDQPAGKGKTRYAKREIKVYKKRAVKSAVLGRIPAGTKLTVRAIKDGWGKVSHDGLTGFVRTRYLSKKELVIDEEGKPTAITDIADASKDDDLEEDPGIDDSGMKKLDARKKGDANWKSLIVLGEGGMPVPQLYQFDDKRVVCYYNGTPRSVSTSGCSVTCLSMVIAYLTGNTDQTPYMLLREACQDGYYRGNGLSRSSVGKLAARYGVAGDWRRLKADEIVEALKAGSPIIVNVAPGYFTERGHYIVLRGLTEDGLVLVNDPASVERSAQAYPPEMLVEQSRSGTSFMVCSPAAAKRAPADTPEERPVSAALQSGLINRG